MPEKLTKHKKAKGAKKHGFLVRQRSKSGKLVHKRRREKGRKRV